ncbi:MAG: hypothetical protein ACXQS3_03025 [Candidatus Methanofastidiosia archaeon]
MDDNVLYGQLYGKYAVDIDGKIRGYVDNVDVEIKDGEIFFNLEMYQYTPSYNVGVLDKNKYGPKIKLTLTPKDIVSVGKDCIIIGFGRIPDLKDIERFKMVMAENEGLRKRYKECQEELDAVMNKLKEKEDEFLELLDRLRMLKRKEDEFDLIKEELTRKNGELKAAYEYMKVIDKLENKVSKLLQQYEGQKS